MPAKDDFYIANGMSPPSRMRKPKEPNAKQFFIVKAKPKAKGASCCSSCKIKKMSYGK
jgi:hypothetical protein